MTDGQSNPTPRGDNANPSRSAHVALDPRLLDAMVRVGALAGLWLLLVVAQLLATRAGT